MLKQGQLANSVLLTCLVLFLAIMNLWHSWAWNRVAVQANKLASTRPPLSLVEVVTNPSQRLADPVFGQILSQFQINTDPCLDVHQFRLLSGLFLLNAQPGRITGGSRCISRLDVLADYFQALACIWQERTCAPAPELARTLRQSGLVLWQTEEFTEGWVRLFASEQLDPLLRTDKALVYSILSAGARSVFNDLPQAIKWAEDLVDATPIDPKAYLGLSALYIEAGQFGDAESALQQAKHYGAPQDWQFDYQMGRLAWEQSEREQAIIYYQIAHDLNPTDLTVAWYLGNALSVVGRPQEACPYLDMVMRTDRTQPYFQALADAAEVAWRQFDACRRESP